MRRLLLLVALALLAPAATAAAQSPTTLVVVEAAEVGVRPDAATIRAEVTRSSTRSAGRARAAVERRVAAALASLEALGVPRADIQTSAIQSYRSRRKGRRIHVATTALTIRLTDLGTVGAVIGALRGTNVAGPDFEISDPTPARQEATTIALQRARARADAAAAALGLRVVRIRRVDLNPEVGYSGGGVDEEGGGGGGAVGGGGPPVQVEPGEETVQVFVAVVYELG